MRGVRERPNPDTGVAALGSRKAKGSRQSGTGLCASLRIWFLFLEFPLKGGWVWRRSNPPKNNRVFRCPETRFNFGVWRFRFITPASATPSQHTPGSLRQRHRAKKHLEHICINLPAGFCLFFLQREVYFSVKTTKTQAEHPLTLRSRARGSSGEGTASTRHPTPREYCG